MLRVLSWLALVAFMWMPASSEARAAQKCIGLKQYYTGKCRYPDEIKKLKAKKVKKRGALGGKCYQNGTCNDGFVCLKKRCQVPPAGTLDGACYGNKTCNAGLTCNDALLCVNVVVGSLGAPCYGNGTCDKGLACTAKLCVKAPEPVPVRKLPAKSSARTPSPTSKDGGMRRVDKAPTTAGVKKLRELPALGRLGIQVFEPHPGWAVAKGSERKPVVRLINPGLGVEFSVSSEVASGSMSLWRGKIRDRLRASGIAIRRSRLMRIDRIAGTLMTGTMSDASGKPTHDYSEVVLKTQRRLIRFIWVNRHGDARANRAFIAALKTAIIAQTRGGRR